MAQCNGEWQPIVVVLLKVSFLFCHVLVHVSGRLLAIGIVWLIKTRRLSPSTSVVPVDARFVAVPVVSVIMSWCSHKLRVVRTCV